jgi:hypothetical protein
MRSPARTPCACAPEVEGACRVYAYHLVAQGGMTGTRSNKRERCLCGCVVRGGGSSKPRGVAAGKCGSTRAAESAPRAQGGAPGTSRAAAACLATRLDCDKCLAAWQSPSQQHDCTIPFDRTHLSRSRRQCLTQRPHRGATDHDGPGRGSAPRHLGPRAAPPQPVPRCARPTECPPPPTPPPNTPPPPPPPPHPVPPTKSHPARPGHPVPPTQSQPPSPTHRVLGHHGAHAGVLAHIPQEAQERHGAKPLQVVEHLGGGGGSTR